MSLTTSQKVIFLGLVPLVAASIGGAATYLADTKDKEQVVVTGEAAKAAKDGKLTIEIVRREESDDDFSAWPLAVIFIGMPIGLAALAWALNRN